MKRLIMKIPIFNSLVKIPYKYVKYLCGRNRLKKIAHREDIKLVIGASGFYNPGWVESDIEYLNLLNPDHWEAVFRRSSIKVILAEHVWEHLTMDEGLAAARRCYEFLAPGGYLRVAVPDGFSPDRKYLAYVEPGGSGAGADTHKVLFNHKSLSDIFQKAGFQVELLEYYDSSGIFHFVDWNPEDGFIRRSRRFDKRNKQGVLKYTSIILDACKDGASPHHRTTESSGVPAPGENNSACR